MSGVIGQSLPRQDGVEKAKGSFQYVSDHFPIDCLTGKLLRSVIPHGRVKSLNLERAKRSVSYTHLTLPTILLV